MTALYFGEVLSDGGGGGVVVEFGSAGGGVVDEELESGGVVVPEGGGVELSAGGGAVVDWSAGGVLDGAVDCCFEQADRATSAPRHRISKLRFIDHLCVGPEQAPGGLQPVTNPRVQQSAPSSSVAGPSTTLGTQFAFHYRRR